CPARSTFSPSPLVPLGTPALSNRNWILGSCQPPGLTALRGSLGCFGCQRGEAVDERRSETRVEPIQGVTREPRDEPLGKVPTECDGETIDDRLVTVRIASVDLGNVCEKPGDRRGVGGDERGDAHDLEYARAAEVCASLARGKRVTSLRDV